MQQFLLDNLLTLSITLISGYMLFWSYFGNRILGVKETEDAVAKITPEQHVAADQGDRQG